MAPSAKRWVRRAQRAPQHKTVWRANHMDSNTNGKFFYVYILVSKREVNLKFNLKKHFILCSISVDFKVSERII